MSQHPKYPPTCGTFQHVGAVAAEIVADLRFRRQVEHLHHLGSRAIGELLAELGAERSIMTLIDQKLDRYAELDPDALEAVGGDDWPILPRRTRS